MSRYLRTFSGVLTCALLTATSAAAQNKRPLAFDDVARLQTVASAELSPDGSLAAVEIQRSRREPPAYRPYGMFGHDGADVWIVPTNGGPARRLTARAPAGAGYWYPTWSPSGRTVAALTSQGGDNVRPVLIDVKTGARTLLSTRAVDTRLSLSRVSDDDTPVRWLDDQRILLALLPTGASPREFAARRETPRRASAAWRKTHEGREPTVNVLSTKDSLPPLITSLVVKNVVTKAEKEIAKGQFSVVEVARSGDVLAAVTVGSAKTVLIVDTRTATSRMVQIPFAATELAWVSDQNLLVRGAPEGQERSDWWTVDPAGERTPRMLTSTLPSEPAISVLTTGASRSSSGAVSSFTVLTVAGGRLWRLLPDSDRPPTSAGVDGVSLTGIRWPSAVGDSAPKFALVVGRRGTARVTYIYDVERDELTELLRPSPTARPLAFNVTTGSSLFLSNDGAGTTMWSASRTRAPASILQLNQHLASSATSSRMRFRYASLSGDSLTAAVLLPANYMAGKRYPMVTWVYPGFMVRDTTDTQVDAWFAKNHSHPDNLHLYAASGFVVLIPSIPDGPLPRRPLFELTGAVLPAVDRAIALGLADSARVAVAGQSAGGFATFGLITQTNRFAAAIAIAGYSNLVSNYGTFSGEKRYGDDPRQNRDRAWLTEVAQGMAVPPWEDIERYTSNSPIAHVHKVQTPLLIIHGDLDYVSIQQAEEFYSAMQKLGKHAEFARYWGESHGVGDSTANNEDRWNRIHEWLGRWLKP